MARAKKRTQQVEEVRPYLEGVAKNLVDKLYGPKGPPWGTKLTAIEDLLLELREVLTEKVLDEALARQAVRPAERPPPHQACSGCGQPVECDDSEPRIVQTLAGEAEWSEPKGYCRKCRQAFFPSVPQSGH